ncbi:MAG: 50S ribosome-binding GTPase [Planctomycetes bacterium]|nr:50S ribosome-binding GTPase [Planctomycetota bacterium]
MTAPRVPRFAFHCATAPGEAGVAIFELYGDGARAALERVFRGRALPGIGASRLGRIVDRGGDVVDEAVITRVGGASMWCHLEAWTLAVHGGAWIQSRLCRVLGEEGGEGLDTRGVLRRALAAGSIDAIEAAAYEHLLDARTERAAGFFSRMHAGELSRELRGILGAARSGGEMGLEACRARLRALHRDARAAVRLARPLRLLLAGRPNCGKSTLFNALAERERVIVSPVAGTTRDLVRETVCLEGFPVEIIDSAGLRPSPEDPVEAQAIESLCRDEADAVIYLLAPPWALEPQDRAFLERREEQRVLVVDGFRDLGGQPPQRSGSLWISALSGEGLAALREAIVRRWIHGGERRSPDDRIAAAPFTDRQTELVRTALEAAERAGDPGSLDEVRRALVICLDSSWPQ